MPNHWKSHFLTKGSSPHFPLPNVIVTVGIISTKLFILSSATKSQNIDKNIFLLHGLKSSVWASLVVQWLRIRLPMQGAWVRALVWEDPTCRGATKPAHHNYWACALEPTSHNYWSLCATTTEAYAPRVRAPQQEKPPQREAHALQQVARIHRN